MTTPQIDDGGDAFPRTTDQDLSEGSVGYGSINSTGGLSKREHFAGLAMQAILSGDMAVACKEIAASKGVPPAGYIAETAFEMADAMIQAGKV